MKFKVWKLGITTLLLLGSAFSYATTIPFSINQTYSQGAGGDLAETAISLGGAGSFFLDPGSSGDYFDFRRPGGGTFSTINTQIGGYYFLDSYALGETIGISNFGNHVSTGDDWDTILVNLSTAGVWGATHSGYLGFNTGAGLFGWIEYDFIKSGALSTIEFLDGAYNDVARADIIAGQAVPVPTTLALFGIGLAGLGLARRKKV